MWLTSTLRDQVKASAPWIALAGLVLTMIIITFRPSADFPALQALPSVSCRLDPASSAPGPGGLQVVRCQAYLVLAPQDIAPPGGSGGQPADLALLAPIFRDSLTVAVNGVQVGQARVNQWQMPARLATVPAIFIIPRANIHPGQNRLDITVTGLGAREPILGKLYVGTEAAILKQFHRLWFVAKVLPTLILGGQAALALMFFAIWSRRRQETALGWFALVLTLEAARNSLTTPVLGTETSSLSYWNLLVPFGSAAYLMFAHSLAEMPNSRRTWLAWTGPIAVALAALISPPAFAAGRLMPVGVAIIGINLVAAAAMLAAGWRRGVPEARLLFICTTLFIGLIVHDVLLSLQWIEGQIAVARPGLLVLLVAMITLMINRFTAAMAELDQTAETLSVRTTEIEAQLRLVDEKLRKERESTILEQERARLMRDLHDGLGGEMVAVLALAERGQGKDEEIAYHARAALADMRLIIASLEDYGGDLGMALGAWKERAEPQILASGMVLHWDLGELGSEPRFGPTQVLDILRILQEALTNVIHHARAANITVGAHLAADHLALTFTDDGKGIFQGARAGKGLANMHGRAAALGGALSLETTEFGTSVLLRLPLQQPR